MGQAHALAPSPLLRSTWCCHWPRAWPACHCAGTRRHLDAPSSPKQVASPPSLRACPRAPWTRQSPPLPRPAKRVRPSLLQVQPPHCSQWQVRLKPQHGMRAQRIPVGRSSVHGTHHQCVFRAEGTGQAVLDLALVVLKETSRCGDTGTSLCSSPRMLQPLPSRFGRSTCILVFV